MIILKYDKKVYHQIPVNDLAKGKIPTLFELPKTALDCANLALFKNWIVGFAMSEGSL